MCAKIELYWKITCRYLFAVKQVLSIDGGCQFVLEEDGTEIFEDVLDAIFEASEKVGVIMVLKPGEVWSTGNKCLPL